METIATKIDSWIAKLEDVRTSGTALITLNEILKDLETTRDLIATEGEVN